MGIFQKKNSKEKKEQLPPKLKYKLFITKTNDPDGYNQLFEVYKLYKDKKYYIASKNIKNNIDIFELSKNKKQLTLTGHMYKINNIKYFINKKNNNQYLISSESYILDPVVIVWDITNNYIIKKRIHTFYNGGVIFSCLLIFPYNHNDDFIITSTSNTSKYEQEDSTKIYSLNDGNLIKNVKDSNIFIIMV